VTTTADRLCERYALGELLGRGGMGAVHRATDERLQREVAVKVLPRIDDGLRDRLRQEARVLAQLDHPALVRLLDADDDDGQPFLVMDLVEGDTLAERLASGPLDEPTVRSVVRQVAEGLVHAHDQGIIHRDLKPANLILEADGRVRVVDFGIARLTDATGLTKPGTAVGTAAYLAPEQLKGDGEIGPPADVYTLGLVALEALTAERPFTGEPVETALARLETAPEIPLELPTPWPDLLREMTALNPEARPTAADVVQRLDGDEQPAGDVTQAQTRAVVLEHTTATLPEPDLGPEPATPPPPAPRRRRRSLPRPSLATAILAAVAVLLAAVLLVVLTSGGDGDDQRPASSGGAELPADVRDGFDNLREAVG
jgi:serine/threonine protein kinase